MKGDCDIAGSHYSPRGHTRAERSASRRSQVEIQARSDAEHPREHSHVGACEQANSDRHPFGLRPRAPARIFAVRRSNPDPVYLRAAAGRSPVVAGLSPAHRVSMTFFRPPSDFARLHDFPPPSALRPPPFFAVHQWINAFYLHNLPTFSKFFQRPRPSQPGQARSASRSAVTVSDLDPASDAGRRAWLEGCPGKSRAISVGVHYSSRCSTSQERGDTETAPGPKALVMRCSTPLTPPSQGWERERASQTQQEWRHRRHPGAIWRHL